MTCLRQFRACYAHNVSISTNVSPTVYPAGKHNNLTVQNKEPAITFDFYWVPYVDSQMRAVVEDLATLVDDMPELVLISAACWHMKRSNSSEEEFFNYKSNLTALAPTLNELAAHTTVIWVSQGPVFERLLTPERKMINNYEIWKYNSAAEVSRLNFIF